MKTTLIISLLCLASLGSYAQTEYTTKNLPPLVNNGKAIPVTPAFDEPFTVVTDNPCYAYKRHGLVVLECPGVWFTPEKKTIQETTVTVVKPNGEIRVQTEGTYMGYYPKLKSDPDMPANAVPAYPTSPYIPLYDPPCYTYKTKSGLEVMECHGLLFPPEHNDK